jgi:hypothetical protein
MNRIKKLKIQNMDPTPTVTGSRMPSQVGTQESPNMKLLQINVKTDSPIRTFTFFLFRNRLRKYRRLAIQGSPDHGSTNPIQPKSRALSPK